jgi:vacuolar-type H+-ATPase subunit I/STV1
MDEDERTAGDDEVIEKFNEMHTEEFIESAELRMVNEKLEKVEKTQQQIEQQQRMSDLKAQAKEDLKLSDINALAKAKEKYAELPEVVKQFDLRIESLKQAAADAAQKEKEKKTKPPAPPAENLEEKLRKFHGQELNYEQLEKLGIHPTGDHMTVGKVKLYRRALFFVYTVDASNG